MKQTTPHSDRDGLSTSSLIILDCSQEPGSLASVILNTLLHIYEVLNIRKQEKACDIEYELANVGVECES